MIKRPAVALALFIVTVLLTVSLASYGQAQTTCDPSVEICPDDNTFAAQAFFADALPSVCVLASAGVGIALGRVL